MTGDRLIRTADGITGAWLAAVLGRTGELTVDSVRPIGTGQMSESHRVEFRTAAGPDSVVVKLASLDPDSRATGVGMGAYRREVELYRHLAPRLGDAVPACHLAVYDEAGGWFTLVLRDLRTARVGDQIAGCDVAAARPAVDALAGIHGAVLGDPELAAAAYLNQPEPFTQALYGALLPGFLDRYGERVEPAHRSACEVLAPVLDAWNADRPAPLGLVHGDFRLDNLLFEGSGAGAACSVVDWQTVSWGPALHDLAYFLGSGLSVADRRAHERDLVRRYHQRLGCPALSWDRCWSEYRRQSFAGILMVVIASMAVQRTERGDAMFMTWFARAAQQVLDLDAASLLPRG